MLYKILKKLTVGCMLLFVLQSIAAQDVHLNLESVLDMGTKKSLILIQSNNKIEIKRVALEHAGHWENPTLDFDVNSKVAREFGNNKLELNSISIGQAIPIFKSSAKKLVATADYKLAQLQKKSALLELRKVLAESYHEVQYHKALWELQEDKLKQISMIQKRRVGKVVHFISSLDKKRLEIIKQNSALEREQALDAFRRSVAQLKNLLDLDLDKKLTFDSISSTVKLKQMHKYLDKVESHPLITSIKLEQEKSIASVKLVKRERFEDPVLTIYRDRDVLLDREQINIGAALTLSIPLWSHNKAEIVGHQTRGRELALGHKITVHSYQGRVKHAYMTLQRQIKLEAQYREKVLKDAKELLRRTIKKFNTGNSSILSLIDVYESYFSYKSAYTAIVFDMRIKVASLKYYSGSNLL